MPSDSLPKLIGLIREHMEPLYLIGIHAAEALAAPIFGELVRHGSLAGHGLRRKDHLRICDLRRFSDVGANCHIPYSEF